jgi:hypothetical protein
VEPKGDPDTINFGLNQTQPEQLIGQSPQKSGRSLLLIAKVAFDLSALKNTGSDALKQLGGYSPLAPGNEGTNMLVGGLAGAGLGALTGLGRDENGERHWLRNALIGGAAGAGVGAAGTSLGRNYVRGATKRHMDKEVTEGKLRHLPLAGGVGGAALGGLLGRSLPGRAIGGLLGGVGGAGVGSAIRGGATSEKFTNELSDQVNQELTLEKIRQGILGG